MIKKTQIELYMCACANFTSQNSFINIWKNIKSYLFGFSNIWSNSGFFFFFFPWAMRNGKGPKYLVMGKIFGSIGKPETECHLWILLNWHFFSCFILQFLGTIISFNYDFLLCSSCEKEIVVYWEELVRKELHSFLKNYQAGYFGYIFSFQREQKESICSFLLCVCFCIQLWCLK